MTAAFFSNLGPAHRPQTRPALAGLPLHSCSRVTTLGSRRFWTSGPQTGSNSVSSGSPWLARKCSKRQTCFQLAQADLWHQQAFTCPSHPLYCPI